ncbi:hypothetical protein ES703_41527 [subsurface metagenome]
MASDWLEVGTLEPNVVQEWVDRYNGPGNGDDSAKAIAIDSNNNVYVTGYGEGVAKDYATIKYSPDSNIRVWMRNTKEQVMSRWTNGTKDLPSF